MASLEELLMNIHDVKTLKAKRTAARKGSIKRLEKHLDTLADVTLAHLPLTNTERKMAVLQENILAYDLIQERMSQVCTDKQLEAEEADEMRQRSHNMKLQESPNTHRRLSGLAPRLPDPGSYQRAIPQRRCHRDLRTPGLRTSRCRSQRVSSNHHEDAT